jgi:hypothetical protein
MRAMLPVKREDGKRRWPRGQKFTLSPAGQEAQAAYREAVAAVRASGRAALDMALKSWAAPRLLAPGDGVVLTELDGKRLGVPHLVEALETSGIERDEVRGAIDRLVGAGLVDLVPLASQLVAAS